MRYLLLLALFLCACGNYDTGYEDAKNGKKKIFLAGRAYRDGYKAYKNDTFLFNTGRLDAYYGEDPNPKYANQEIYMKGYKAYEESL